MSRFHDEQQPDAFVESEERRPEQRLLTRRGPLDAKDERPKRRTRKIQHGPEKGLNPWAARLRAKRAQPSPSDRRRRRLALWTAGLLLALACIGAIAIVVTLRHALVTSLPQLDGQVHIPGLHAPVTVTRDERGVPSITASSLDDLLFAQGYITASDRLWQMDGIRRDAAGDLAAILGPGLVEHDRRQRLLQIRATADRAVARLPPGQLAQLEAYARGVNAFIESHRDRLPVEFRLLAYKPAPWSPRDSLLISLEMWQELSTGFPAKLNREVLSAHLPAELLPDLYPVGSWRDQPPNAQSPNLAAPHDVEQIPLDPSQSRLHPPAETQPATKDLLAVSAALEVKDRCEDCRPGSNNWAVSGAHTASGAPLLSNDMHLGLAIPDIWYETSLHADLSSADVPGSRLDVSGFALPGVPFIIVGRNAHVAWGVTNLGGDVQDLRVEHLRGSGDNTQYERPDGSWALAMHHQEIIRVRAGRNVTVDVLTTEHQVGSETMETPIISPVFHTEKRALSLAWSAYDPGAVNDPFFGINTAVDGSSLVAAFATFGGPSLNLVWADAGGHIGYHAVGRIPIRGPAVQHPRAVQSPLPPNGPMPPEGDDDEGSEPAEPQAQLATQPHLLLSAYPVRRRRTVRHIRSEPQHRSRRTGRGSIKIQQPAAIEAPVLPSPQPRNYTVGSPISPVPVDALDPAQEWSGYISYGDLPSVTDPPGGILATANARITPDDYPWAVANDWPDPFRVERIVHLLSGRTGLTPADMLRMQMDVHSDVNQAIAQRLAYALDHASQAALGSDAKRLRQAADLMRDWNGEMRTSSPTAAVVAAVRKAIWPTLLSSQIMAHDGSATDARAAAELARLYTWDEQITALELLLQNQPARWLPHGHATWNDFLASITEQALKTAHAPSDLRSWRYGQVHTIDIAHPLFGDQPILSSLLGVSGSTGRQPAPGDATTIDAVGARFGPSERFTADLSSPESTYANITPGEAENEHSAWYLDQFPAWLHGSTYPLPLNDSHAAHTLTLLPQ